jgi:PAS domain S-box-containing protein
MTQQNNRKPQTLNQELQQFKDIYHEIFENTADAVCVIEAAEDGNFKFISVNPTAQRVILCPSKICGIQLKDCLPENEAKRLAANYNRCIQGRTIINYDESFHTSEGELFFNTTLIPLKGHQGQISRIICISHDITERQHALEQSKIEKNKLQSFIDALQCGITILDLDYNILFQNEYMLKIHGDFSGKKCFESYENSHEICSQCPSKACLQDCKVHIAELQIRLSDGETQFWENTASPIFGADGKITAIL